MRLLRCQRNLDSIKKRTEALGAACNLIRCNFTQQVTRGVSLDEKLALMREYVPFATAFYDTVDDAGVPPEMQKSSCVLLRWLSLSQPIGTRQKSMDCQRWNPSGLVSFRITG